MCECINEERVGKEEEKKRKNRKGRKKDIHFGPGDTIQDFSNTLLKNNRSLWPRCLPVSYSWLPTVFQNLSSGTFVSHIHRCQPGLTRTRKFTDKGSLDPSSHSHPPPRQRMPWRNGHVSAGWGQGPSISLLGTSGGQRGCSTALHPEHGQCLSSGGREPV